MNQPFKLLFVCMGNICRSPAAECIMRAKLAAAGLGDTIVCDSAGTIGFHAGAPPDERMTHAAARRGYRLAGAARPVTTADLDQFDRILVMDNANLRDVQKRCHKPEHLHKIMLFTDFCQRLAADHVPDPYYGGPDGFDRVLDIVEDACNGLLEDLHRDR
jgi:protein-tyrosine phosphatase